MIYYKYDKKLLQIEKVSNIDITKLQKNCYKSYKKLLQKWERQTNKQTKTKQTKRLIII